MIGIAAHRCPIPLARVSESKAWGSVLHVQRATGLVPVVRVRVLHAFHVSGRVACPRLGVGMSFVWLLSEQHSTPRWFGVLRGLRVTCLDRQG